MSRNAPLHAGYTILSGSGTGSNGGRIDVWVEYLVGSADTANNRTYLTAYFYAALNPSYTSSTSYYTGLDSAFSVDGKAATAVSDGAYDFTSSSKVNLLGSFAGYIGHDADGTKNVKLEGSFTTASSYITGGNVSGTVTLPAIARAAEVIASAVTLGAGCNVSWTPAASRHSFSLAFSLGNWSAATERLYPAGTSVYTYTGLTLPLEAARQFAGATGEMTVTLTTYDGDTVLGTGDDTFTVTLPENDATRPTVTAVLSPVCDAFPGLYVQKLGRVSAAVAATDPLGAAITGYTVSAGGAAVSGTVSGCLEKSGAVTVTVTAVNSRGFTGTYTEEVTVLAYDSPRLLTADAYRCLSDGTADPGGTFLRIIAQWSHSPVEGENACSLRWRCKQEDGAYTDWQTLSDTSAVDTGAMAGTVLEKTQAYTVELEAVDTAGGTAAKVFSIPIEQVYMHRTKNAMGLGGYAEEADVLDVHWGLRARQNVDCQGSVSGLFIRTVRLSGTKDLQVQTRWSGFSGTGSSRQSIFLFGYDNGLLVRGLIGIRNTGETTWDGTSGVTVTGESATGVITVTLPALAYDSFVLLSADPITVV